MKRIWCNWVSVGLLIIGMASSGQAEEFCVETSGQLTNALATAAVNFQSDLIKLVTGVYSGSFVYASSESENLEVIGGYSSGCLQRSPDPDLTILTTASQNPVLVLTNINSDPSITILLEGLTIQGGNDHGLFVQSAGTVEIVGNVFYLNSGWYGGALAMSGSIQPLLLSIRNNRFESNFAGTKGGALYLVLSETVEILDNYFQGNVAGGDGISGEGGGLFLVTSEPVSIIGNIFHGNTAGRGGGAYVRTVNVAAEVAQNAFTENIASGDLGGGLWVLVENHPWLSEIGFVDLDSNLFAGNSADQEGGGAYVAGINSETRFVNNSVIGNLTIRDTSPGGGVYIHVFADESYATVVNNLFHSNYSPAGGRDLAIENDGNANFFPSPVILLSNGIGSDEDFLRIAIPFAIDASNVDVVNPQFVSFDLGDYRLEPSSPFIDAGNSDYADFSGLDLLGNPRIVGQSVDIGAYEFPIDSDGDGVPDASDNCTGVINADQYDANGDGIGSLCDADIAGLGGLDDCTVNFLDLNAMKAAFFSNSTAPGWNPDADLDNSGIVSFVDLQIMKAQFFGPPGPSGVPNVCTP